MVTFIIAFLDDFLNLKGHYGQAIILDVLLGLFFYQNHWILWMVDESFRLGEKSFR